MKELKIIKYNNIKNNLSKKRKRKSRMQNKIKKREIKKFYLGGRFKDQRWFY